MTQLEEENLELRQQLFDLCTRMTGLCQGDDDKNDNTSCRCKVLFLPLSVGRDHMTELTDDVVNKLQRRLQQNSSPLKESLDKHETKLKTAGSSESSPTSSVTSTSVVSELREMFSDGKKLLALNEELQAAEEARLRKERTEMTAERNELDKAKAFFLLAAHCSEEVPPFEPGNDGPTWSWSNASVSLASKTTSWGSSPVTIGPQYRLAGSRSASNSRASSRVRSKRRPKSTNLSPARGAMVFSSSDKSSLVGAPSPWQGGPTMTRTGSMSPRSRKETCYIFVQFMTRVLYD